MRVVSVSYLNSKPFLEGLASVEDTQEWSIQLAPPSQCAEAFANQEADIALVPVGALPYLKEYTILDQFCIGADGPVNSVFLFAQQSIEHIHSVYEDWHSKTSNGLCKILMKNHWKKEVQWLKKEDYFSDITEDKAGVVIGDKSIPLIPNFVHVYDLSAEWKKMTNLPFAFAVWIMKSSFAHTSIPTILKHSFRQGMNQFPQIAEKWHRHFGLTSEAALTYFSESIDYALTEEKKIAMQLYLQKLSEILLFQAPSLSFV